MSAPMKRKLLTFLNILITVILVKIFENVFIAASQDFHDYFLCRKCGREIVRLSDMINVPSPVALRQRNDTFGPKREVLIQLFKNPQGAYYEVVTSSHASFHRASSETGGDTWWPGFNWIILGCPQCRQHIGWEYIPADKSDKTQNAFFGLVLNNLLYENEADSLIVVPKSYTS